MRGTAALKSIEALYKEAETVINDGVPMVAIMKSAPPVAKPDIPVATRPLATAPHHAQPDHSAQDRSSPNQIKPEHKAPNQKNPDPITQAPGAVFDRIEMLSAMAASLDEDIDKAKTEPAPALPDAPPVPDYAGGTWQISDADLENVVKKAVDDLVTTTPLDDVIAGNERIESVMADIAEAVGNAETSIPAEPSESASTSDHGADADPAPASGTQAQPTASAKAAAAIDLDDLNDIVANTVKSVIREELSNLVQSTVKSTLDELRATHDDKAKSTLSDH